MTEGLRGRRVLVVGASAGIGRAFALRAIAAGADVVVSARREERLKELVAEAGSGAIAPGDLRDAADCRAIAANAAGVLDEIDLVLFSAGMAPLVAVEDTSPDDWTATFETNTVGINLLIAALLPHLARGAIVAALSSEAVGHPHFGLAAYGASKAALDESLRAWRLEHPELRFASIAVGGTFPTEFGTNFDDEFLAKAMRRWAQHGHAQANLMDTDEVATVLTGLLGAALPFPGVGMETVLLRSPAAVLDHADTMFAGTSGEDPEP